MIIPRLELTAARVTARLATTVREALKEFGIKKVYMWSDSCTVLNWLERRVQYQQFVEHRVKEIEQLTSEAEWRYCQTNQNPADLGTRGKSPVQLSESDLWWKGPPWLISEKWPEQPHLTKGEEIEDEEIKPAVQVTTVKRGMRDQRDLLRLQGKRKENYKLRFRIKKINFLIWGSVRNIDRRFVSKDISPGFSPCVFCYLRLNDCRKLRREARGS